MAEVSIIVPVYQVETYIRQCIESILAQTFTDFELILVDDGSTDRSGSICDEYAAKDKRVRVIHQRNGGLSDARNQGMDKATGHYFMFVDGDDCIAPTMTACLYQSILKENADMAACNFCYFFAEDEQKNFCTGNKEETLCGRDIFYNRKNERNYGFWTVAWNKLYKAETFQTVRFRVGKFHEDEFWANDIYRMDIQVVTVSACLYYYRQRANGIMGNKNIQKCFDITEAFAERIHMYLKEETYSPQAYKVLIYLLEHLTESKKLIKNDEDKKHFVQAERQTKSIIRELKKRKLSPFQKASLLFIGINPCLVFSVGIKFRGLLEKHL